MGECDITVSSIKGNIIRSVIRKYLIPPATTFVLYVNVFFLCRNKRKAIYIVRRDQLKAQESPV